MANDVNFGVNFDLLKHMAKKRTSSDPVPNRINKVRIEGDYGTFEDLPVSAFPGGNLPEGTYVRGDTAVIRVKGVADSSNLPGIKVYDAQSPQGTVTPSPITGPTVNIEQLRNLPLQGTNTPPIRYGGGISEQASPYGKSAMDPNVQAPVGASNLPLGYGKGAAQLPQNIPGGANIPGASIPQGANLPGASIPGGANIPVPSIPRTGTVSPKPTVIEGIKPQRKYEELEPITITPQDGQKREPQSIMRDENGEKPQSYYQQPKNMLELLFNEGQEAMLSRGDLRQQRIGDLKNRLNQALERPQQYDLTPILQGVSYHLGKDMTKYYTKPEDKRAIVQGLEDMIYAESMGQNTDILGKLKEYVDNAQKIEERENRIDLQKLKGEQDINQLEYVNKNRMDLQSLKGDQQALLERLKNFLGHRSYQQLPNLNAIGGIPLTKGQTEQDKSFGKRWEKFKSGEGAAIEEAIGSVNRAIDILNKAKQEGVELSGRTVRSIYDASGQGKGIGSQATEYVLNKFGGNYDLEKTRIVKQLSDTEAVETMKQKIGSQFTEKEGTEIKELSYDISLSPEENLIRLKKLKNTLSKKYKSILEMGEIFDSTGTIRGYKYKPGKTQLSREEMLKQIKANRKKRGK